MTTKEYNEVETGKINAYLKSNNIDLDKGIGFESFDTGFSAREYQIGGPFDYKLILMRIHKEGKSTSKIEGPQEKINELEKSAKVIN
jgi:hypothetical protein